jgi:hypothetical protein
MSKFDKIEKINSDFENSKAGFDKTKFPEKRLSRKLGEDKKLEYLTVFVMWDYNRSVDQLVENIIEIYNNDKNFFEVENVVENMTIEDLKNITNKVKTRYNNRDAEYYYDNVSIIYEEYNKDWENLLKTTNYDAKRLVEELREKNFKTLSGDKLAPFYARVINDEYKELENLWELEIPVDTHIRRLSKDLFDKENMSDDQIRQKWREIGEKLDISPHIIDGGLWQVGYDWDDWGKEYWRKL